jgi:hypothetical protein
VLPLNPSSCRDKAENFAAVLAAEPYAVQIALINIFLLFVGFALSLTTVSCNTDSCTQAGNIGQVVVAISAFLLASVEAYMTFVVAIIPVSL